MLPSQWRFKRHTKRFRREIGAPSASIACAAWSIAAVVDDGDVGEGAQNPLQAVGFGRDIAREHHAVTVHPRNRHLAEFLMEVAEDVEAHEWCFLKLP